MTELQNIASDLLKQNKNDVAAAVRPFVKVLSQRRELLNALAHEYLKSLGQSLADAQTPNAETAAAGHVFGDAQHGIARSGTKSKKPVKVVEHRRAAPHRREQDNEAAIWARTRTAQSLVLDHRFNGRRLRDYSKAELPQLYRELSEGTASYIMWGTDMAHYALLIDFIDRHAQVPQETKVGEFISDDVADELNQRAIEKAPQAVSATVQGAVLVLNQELRQITP